MELLLALPGHAPPPGRGAAAALLLRNHPRVQLWLTILTLVAILSVAVVLGLRVPDAGGVLVLQIGNWTRSWASCWSRTV